MYRVEFRPAAVKQLEGLPRSAQRRVLARVEALGRDPRPPGCRKLTGAENTYRIRIGRYRVIYDVLDDRLVVLVVKVGHRREVYRRA